MSYYYTAYDPNAANKPVTTGVVTARNEEEAMNEIRRAVRKSRAWRRGMRELRIRFVGDRGLYADHWFNLTETMR